MTRDTCTEAGFYRGNQCNLIHFFQSFSAIFNYLYFSISTFQQLVLSPLLTHQDLKMICKMSCATKNPIFYPICYNRFPHENRNKEQQSIEDLVEELKNNVKYVHTFLLLFNGQDPRLSMGLQSMLRTLEKIFGNHFWRNVILGVSRWGYDHRSIERRRQSEEEWITDWDMQIQKRYDVDVSNSPKCMLSVPVTYCSIIVSFSDQITPI